MRKIAILLLSFLPVVALAAPATYDLLAPIGTLPTTVTLTEYLQGIFKTIVGIVGVLAVIMIVVCGIRLMGSGSAGGKSEAKQCIWNAVFGILLAIGSWLLLNTINPLLLKNDATLSVAPAVVGAPTPPAPPSGTLSWKPGPICPSIVGKIVGKVAPSFCAGPPPMIGDICCRYVDIIIPPPPPVGLPPPVPSPLLPPPVPPLPPPIIIPSVSFMISTAMVSEGAGSITLVVKRVGLGAGTVDYSTVSGTAIAGSDFVAVSGTLVFPAGVTRLTITVPIINDITTESNEQFTVNLFNSTGTLTLGSTPSVVVTILDNDTDITPPVVIITQPLGGLATTSSVVSLTFTASDNFAIDRASVQTLSPDGGVFFSTSICTSGTCPTPIMTKTVLMNLDTTKVGFHQFAVKVCDPANNCTTKKVSIEVQPACTSSATTTCYMLPALLGGPPNPPLCRPANGRAVTTARKVDSYEFKITSPAGGGAIHIVGDDQPEFPVPATLAAALCPGPPPVCPDFGLGPICPAIILPPDVLASISEMPGDLSSGAVTVASQGKNVSGFCGNGGSLGSRQVDFTIATGGGVRTCVLQLNRTYYLNISTVQFAGPISSTYTLFWDWLPTSGGPPPPPPPPPATLIAHWKFDEGVGLSAADSSGSGNTATLSGSSAWVAGKMGFGVSLNGVSGSINAAVAPAINPNGSFSYSMWVYPRNGVSGGANDGNGTYILDRQVANNPLVSLKVVGGKYCFQTRYNDGTGLGCTMSRDSIITNAWTKIVLIRDYNNYFSIYVNGVRQGITLDTGSQALTPQPPKIGSHFSGSGVADGNIDDVRIYSGVLTDAEIAAL